MKVCPQCRNSFPTEFQVCPTDNLVLEVNHELGPGMTIRGKYLIIDQIGEGGMGKVFSARHLAFNELRALKVINPLFAGDSTYLRRFKTEAVVARKLQHPNAVRIDDLDTTDDGLPFIVMELVDGENLKSRIMRLGTLSVKDSIDVATQTADALGAAHDLGIVHRDIKPDNILLARTQDGHDLVKVADLGIAKVRGDGLDLQSGYTATRSGMIIGTPQYLSPEQAMGTEAGRIDGRADIYSLGMVLFVMLTGRLPFESDTPLGFLVHHVHTLPPNPREIRPDLPIPGELSSIVGRMLEKDRNKRFATAHELSHALRNVGSGISISAQPAISVGVGVIPSTAPSAPPSSVGDHDALARAPSAAMPVCPRHVLRNTFMISGAVAILMIIAAIAFHVLSGNGLSAQHPTATSKTPSANTNRDRSPRANAPTASVPAPITTPTPGLAAGPPALGTLNGATAPVAKLLESVPQARKPDPPHSLLPAENAKDITAALALSEVYADHGECDQAIAKLEESLKAHPGNRQLARRIADLRSGACATKG